MTRLPAIFYAALWLGAAWSGSAQPAVGAADVLEFKGTHDASYTKDLLTLTFTNGAVMVWHGAVITAQRGVLEQNPHDKNSGQLVADGHVQIQREDQVWVGEHVVYDFKTHQISTAEFRTGRTPVFAMGHGLQGELTNKVHFNDVYFATNAFVTTDDVSQPDFRIRANRIRLIPNQRIEAWNATLWVGEVPVFYFPYYSRNLGEHPNNFNFTPGYGSLYGAYLLSDYTWYLNTALDGKLHLDYRTERGVGLGPDLNLHLGRWGDVQLKTYYMNDQKPGTNVAGWNLPRNRELIHFSYQATPWTNLNVKALVRYQNDTDLVKDFYLTDYRENPQPDSFVEVNKSGSNFSLDVLTQPRLNNFLETVTRLPDVKLTGFPQQIGVTPLYYESESAIGYYQRLFAVTNSVVSGLDYAATRADTYHQITLPKTLFGWLNLTPRVGGRLSYYSQADGPGATTGERYREVFNTGAELTFKASRVWPQVENRLLDLSGVRHIIQPSVNYAYVPRPNHTPDQLPMFDYQLPSLRQLPLNYPANQAIDSINSQNVVRLGLMNKLQTKRDGQVEDFLKWELSTDWQFDPGTNQGTFGDLFSDLAFKPRSWLRIESQTRYDLNAGDWRMLLHTVTFEPNNVWSWTVGHFYLRSDLSGSPTALGPGNNLITSSLFYRLNENWGFRSTHYFDSIHGRMEEQYYTVYRDLRSFTLAVTGGLRDSGTGPKDFNVAFSFSLKALPHGKMGSDTARPYSLLGQ